MLKPKSQRPRILLINRCIVKDEQSGKILLIKRSKKDRYNPGKWEIPGGKLEIGQDPTRAIETEVLEECNLYVKLDSPKFFVETKSIITGGYKGLPRIAIIGEATLIGGNLKLSKEHTSHKWVFLDEIHKMDTTEITKKALAALNY